MYSGYSHIKIDRKGPILTVTLDNPPTNSVTKGMHGELATIFEAINRDVDTKVVIVTGAGSRAFSAGGDFNDMKRSILDPRGFMRASREGIAIINGLLRLEKPIIARINSHAIGFGATLALFCDLTYVDENAKIGDPHVGVGYAAGDGGALIWPQLIGYARAREYLFTGDTLTGAMAAQIGLVTRAVPREKLDETVNQMAERLSNGATFAINTTKQAVNMTLRRQFEAVVEAHAALEIMSHFTNDHNEAVDAFIEKRAPNFTGS